MFYCYLTAPAANASNKAKVLRYSAFAFEKAGEIR